MLDTSGTVDVFLPDWKAAKFNTETIESNTQTFQYPIHPRDRLRNQVDTLCRYARFAYDIEDKEALSRAQNEANLLIYSGVFSEDFSPDIHVDEYGEISFTKRFSCGYIDIGVSGNGELSFHVRNDLDPSLTQYADHFFGDASIPLELLKSIEDLIGCSKVSAH